MDEMGKILSPRILTKKCIWKYEEVEIQDFKAKLKPTVFDKLKALADKKVGSSS